jgi:hypothetical protein
MKGRTLTCVFTVVGNPARILVFRHIRARKTARLTPSEIRAFILIYLSK